MTVNSYGLRIGVGPHGLKHVQFPLQALDLLRHAANPAVAPWEVAQGPTGRVLCAHNGDPAGRLLNPATMGWTAVPQTNGWGKSNPMDYINIFIVKHAKLKSWSLLFFEPKNSG